MNSSVWKIIFMGEGGSAVRTSKQVRGELAQVEHQSKRTAGGFRTAERDLGKLTRGGIAGSGMMRGLGRSLAFASASFLGGVGFVAAVRSAISAAGDLNTQTARSVTVFRGSGREIQAWSKGTYQSLGIARTTALETANAFGTLLASARLDPSKSAAFARDLTRAAAAISLARGEADPSAARQALAVGLAGRGRALRLYGIQLDQVAIKEEAARLGLIRSSVDSTKLSLARDRLSIATAKAAEAHKKYGANTTQALAADDEVVRAQQNLRKVASGTGVAISRQATAIAAHSIIMRQAQRYIDRYGESMNTSAGRQRRFHEGAKQLREELGTELMPTFNHVLNGVNRYIASITEGGTRHAAFVRTLHNVGGALHTTWTIAKQLVGGLKLAADTVGGWQNAFKLVLGLVLVNKFLTLAGAIRGSRLALVLLGKQAVVTGTTVEAEEAGMGASADVAAGKVGGIITKLRLLAKTAAVPIVATLIINEIIKKATGFDALGRAWGTAGFGADNVSGEKPVAGSKNPYPKGTPDWRAWNLGYKDSKKRTKGVGTTDAYQKGYKAGHGVGGSRTSGAVDKAAFIAVQASRSSNAGSTSFHLPGEAAPYDCSAFVQAVYRRAGISIGRTTYDQVKQGTPVGRGQLRAGDLIFMNFPGERSPGHVGIYVGNGYMVHDHGAHGGVSYQVVPWGSVVALRNYDGLRGGGPAVNPSGTGGASGSGDVTVGHAASTPSKPHYVSRSSRIAERYRIDAYETRIRQADKKGYITDAEEKKDIARLERLRKQLAKPNLTSGQMANIRGQVARLWAQINAEIGKGVKAARLKAQQLAKAHAAALRAAEKAADVARGNFENAWTSMADKALEAFDRITQRGEDAISARYDQLTEAEKALQALQDQGSQVDLQGNLALAERLGDPQMIAEAKRALLEDQLTKQAAIERAAADAAKQKALQEYDDQRKIQRDALEKQLDDLEKKLESGQIKWSDAQKELKKLLGDQIGPFGSLGALIGDAFTQSLLDSITGVGGTADAIQKALDEVKKLGYRWNPDTGEWEKNTGSAVQPKPKPRPAPGPPPPPPGHPPPDSVIGALMAGVGAGNRSAFSWVGSRYSPVASGAQKALQTIAAAVDAGQLGGGDTHVHVHLHGMVIGDDRRRIGKEVAGPVREELLRMQGRGSSLGIQRRRRFVGSSTPEADSGFR